MPARAGMQTATGSEVMRPRCPCLRVVPSWDARTSCAAPCPGARENVQLTSTLRVWPLPFFGTIRVRMPFSNFASTLAFSTANGSVNVR